MGEGGKEAWKRAGISKRGPAKAPERWEGIWTAEEPLPRAGRAPAGRRVGQEVGFGMDC